MICVNKKYFFGQSHFRIHGHLGLREPNIFREVVVLYLFKSALSYILVVPKLPKTVFYANAVNIIGKRKPVLL